MIVRGATTRRLASEVGRDAESAFQDLVEVYQSAGFRVDAEVEHSDFHLGVKLVVSLRPATIGPDR